MAVAADDFRVAGVDLAAGEENETGFAVIEGLKLHTSGLFTLDEITDAVMGAGVVEVDAPLSLPRGRCCLERDCECSRYGHFRRSDMEARRYGGVLPLTWRGMKELTLRGIELRKRLEGEVKVIETHPGTVRRMRNITGELRETFNPGELNRHRMDALIAAAVALFYMRGRYIELGDPDEGTIILPAPEARLKDVIFRDQSTGTK